MPSRDEWVGRLQLTIHSIRKTPRLDWGVFLIIEKEDDVPILPDP
jgi:hypothetical protein